MCEVMMAVEVVVWGQVPPPPLVDIIHWGDRRGPSREPWFKRGHWCEAMGEVMVSISKRKKVLEHTSSRVTRLLSPSY